MEYRKLAKLSVNLLLLTYIRNFLVLALAEERLLRDGAGKRGAVYLSTSCLTLPVCVCAVVTRMQLWVFSLCLNMRATYSVLFVVCCVLSFDVCRCVHGVL